jgi:hypothetical protein
VLLRRCGRTCGPENAAGSKDEAGRLAAAAATEQPLAEHSSGADTDADADAGAAANGQLPHSALGGDGDGGGDQTSPDRSADTQTHHQDLLQTDPSPFSLLPGPAGLSLTGPLPNLGSPTAAASRADSSRTKMHAVGDNNNTTGCMILSDDSSSAYLPGDGTGSGGTHEVPKLRGPPPLQGPPPLSAGVSNLLVALLLPRLRERWLLPAALGVAAMSYTFMLYTSTMFGAFTCVHLAAPPSVPGEVSLPSSVWLPDTQLVCGSGQHLAVALLAAVLGVPALLWYGFALLVLAWPPGAAAAAAAGGGDKDAHTNGDGSSTTAALQHPLAAALYDRRVRAAVQRPPSALLRAARRTAAALGRALVRPLARLVCLCHARTQAAGVHGSAVAGLDVWNASWRWWWLPLREAVKVVLLVVSIACSARASAMQAPAVAAAVVVASMLTWCLQPGCSTSMNWLLYVMYCSWTLLTLLVLVLAIPGVSGAALGGVLLGLMAASLLGYAAIVAGSLVWRCLQTAKSAWLTRQRNTSATAR